MKKRLLTSSLTFFIFLATVLSGSAQIIIDNTDMPAVHDEYLVNSATPSPAIDPVPTGVSFLWDFSSLTSASQNTDTFKTLIELQSVYALAFIGSSYGLRSAQDVNLGAFTMTKIYNLYKNSTSKYEGSGQGAEINSIPTPMVFNPRDLIYKFPLNFGDTDSSSTSFSITIPTIATYRKFRKRVNVVDGWGTLKLPAGDFNVIRVKSIVSDRDSIALTAVPIPLVIPSTTIEYKWLGKLQGEPLLQINANQFAVTQVLYLDNPVLGIADADANISSFDVYPNPATDKLFVTRDMAYDIRKIEIYDGHGQCVFIRKPEAGSQQQALIDVSSLKAGIYFLKIISEKSIAYKKFSVIR